jgi:hypothetical protein
MGWTYIEPCCGSASTALHLLGARRPLLPYQGAKWRFRREWRAHLDALGFADPPAAIVLGDAGPWGDVAPTVLGPERPAVIAVLEGLAAEDPRTVYDRLHRHPVPADASRYAAEFLFLQRLAYSGKAVGDPNGCWSSPGFNTSSAYGLAGTDRFGAVKPMIPSLIRVLRSYDDLLPVPTSGARRPAVAPACVDDPTLVYLDPPYAGSTRYPMGDLSRDDVVRIALGWHAAGAVVVVSEGEPIDALVDRGWTASLLNPGRQDTSRFRGKQAEWMTSSPTIPVP